MAPNSSRRKLLAIAGATGVLAAAPSFASGFPERPVRLIVPYPAGGGADGWARMVAGRLEKVLGQPVVFDYRPGASTTIGAEATARAAPDGYTIHLLDSTGFAYVPNLRKVNYDPVGSFTALSSLGIIPMVLIANPSVPARNIQELIAYARANPGKLSCASSGIGSPHHLIAELLQIRAGIKLNHVPYKGAVQYVADILAGHVDLAVSTIGPAVQHIQSGRMIALGVTTAKRSVALPDVPAIGEQGVDGFDEKPWNCFVAPAGVPAEALTRLRSAFKTVLAEPELIVALEKAGIEEVGAMSPEQVTSQIAADLSKWGEVIRQAKITIE
jgi:tripartite-type tricarboxylate transporter receptor subunit TctC